MFSSNLKAHFQYLLNRFQILMYLLIYILYTIKYIYLKRAHSRRQAAYKPVYMKCISLGRDRYQTTISWLKM